MLKQVLIDNGDGTGNITIFVGGTLYSATSDHPNYRDIVDLAKDGDESVIDLFDVGRTIERQFSRLGERVTVEGNDVKFDGDVMDNALTQTILRFLDNGNENDWKPLVSFFEKVMTNPERHSREQLFTWLNDRNFTITNEGNIVMYKGVEADLSSVHSGDAIVNGEHVLGKIPNTVGSIIEMPRSTVQHDPLRGCHVGLHAAGHDFASGWGSVIISLIVNPRDVVSVPTDSNYEKVRCCRYQVKSIVSGPTDSLVLKEDEDWDF